jgi:hypothetical protein
MDVKEKERTVIKFLLLEGGSRRGNRYMLRGRVWLSCVLSRFSIQMDQRSFPRQRRTPKRRCSGRCDRHETDAVSSTKKPNAWLRSILDTLLILLETFRTHTLRIGDTLKTLLWIPRILTCELKHVCLSICLR